MALSYDYLVAGGGIAGISAAARLAGRRRSVAVLETEEGAPKHATARSAALKDPVYVPNADVAGLAMASAGMFGDMPTVLRPKAAVHLYGRTSLGEYADAVARCRAVGAPVEELQAPDVEKQFPFLRLSRDHCVAALFAPPGAANTIDVAALYDHYHQRLRVLGGQVLLGESLVSARRVGGGWTVETSKGIIRTRVIVNCAGAWADIVAARCGVNPLGLVPLKRTVIETTLYDHPLAPVPEGPFVFWNSGDGMVDLYADLKRDGKVLLSPADEQLSQPCDAKPDARDIGTAIDRFLERTHLRVLNFRGRHWAGLRTFAADRRPVIGWSNEVQGFFWSAAYGGFGIECSPAASAIAADMILGENSFSALKRHHPIRLDRFAPARLRPVLAGRR